MQVKKGVELAGLHPCMRPVLRIAEELYHENGIAEGITITSTRDGVHSAASWHPYGLAVDLRSRMFTNGAAEEMCRRLRELLPAYDVVHHAGDEMSHHIHIEVGNALADDLGVLF